MSLDYPEEEKYRKRNAHHIHNIQCFAQSIMKQMHMFHKGKLLKRKKVWYLLSVFYLLSDPSRKYSNMGSVTPV